MSASALGVCTDSDKTPPPTNTAVDADLEARVAEAIALLEELSADKERLALLSATTYKRLQQAAGQIARLDKSERRALVKALRRQRRSARKANDEAQLEATGIRSKRREAVFQTPQLAAPPWQDGTSGSGTEHPGAPTAEETAPKDVTAEVSERSCYVCKVRYTQLHHFYDQLCPSCGELNWQKRHQSADLRGRVALVTGARVKIGYQAAVKLLRAGAHVVVTTRFPRDAAARYAREEDYADWGHRLDIYGLDLRHTPSVERLARHLDENLERLDFILNNACQTVRRPPGFYQHLLDAERLPFSELRPEARRLLANHEDLCTELALDLRRQLPEGSGSAPEDSRSALSKHDRSTSIGLEAPAELSQLVLVDDDRRASPGLFPEGQLDADLQQIDLRAHNSWRLTLAEVPTLELLEVHLVNAVAPFVLNARLKPLMLRHPSNDKHIVNVSAMEGQFYRRHKTDKHPHTNMAKASLNMMTRTSAVDYAKDGIHINSVDTGWVTDEDPAELAARKVEVHGFHPPLDIVDGAARICDPIFDGFATGVHRYGLFLKDYEPTDW